MRAVSVILITLAIIAATSAISVPANVFSRMTSTQREQLKADFNKKYVAKFHANVANHKSRQARGQDVPIPVTPGVTTYPGWDVPTYQLGESRFLGAFSNSSTAVDHTVISTEYAPSIYANDPVNQRLFIGDPIAGQHTDATGSYQWFPSVAIGGDFITYICTYEPTATYAQQQAVHRSATLLDVRNSLDIQQPQGNSGKWRTVSVAVNTYGGVTRDYGAGPDSWMGYTAFTDVYTQKLYYFAPSAGVGGLRNPGCPSCTPNPNIFIGEYAYFHDGAVISDIEAADPGVWELHPSCYLNGNASLGLSPDILPYAYLCFQ